MGILVVVEADAQDAPKRRARGRILDVDHSGTVPGAESRIFEETEMTVTTLRGPLTVSNDRVAIAARHLYDAEFALHAADESHVDAWITAASEKLHLAVLEHTAACCETVVAPHAA